MTLAARLIMVATLGASLVACGTSTAKNGTNPGGDTGTTTPVTPPATLDIMVVAIADGLSGGTAGPSVQLALAELGFDQLTSDGTKLLPPLTPAQGIGFEQGDAAIIASGMGDGPRMSLDDLLGGWAAMTMTHTTSDADWAAMVATMRTALVADLTAASVSTSDTYRYWAQLIVQLGRISPDEYDLLDPAVPGNSLLDPMQVALLSYRFQAELWVASRKAAGLSLQPRPTWPRAVATPRPCTMTETEGTIMDGAAVGSGMLMTQILGALEKTIHAAEKAGKFLDGANAALNLVKFAWTMAAFEAHITADTNLLFRTTNATPGGPATLTATFQFNSGNAQVVNCLRPALNAIGIDFSLPQDGPITDAALDWEAYNDWERTVKLPIIYFPSSALNHRTDANGQDTVDIMGSPKRPPLTGTIVPDYRLPGFAAKIALKDTKMGQGVIDAIGITATAASNPLFGALNLLTETLYRAKSLVFAGYFTLPVEDHQSLDNVIMTAELNGTISGALSAGGKGSETADASVYLLEKPAPSAQPITFVIYNNTQTAGAMPLKQNGLRLVSYHGSGTFTASCMCVTGTETTTVQGSASGSSVNDGADFMLLVSLQPDGTFSMDLPLGTVTLNGGTQTTLTGCDPTPTTLSDTISKTYDLGKVTITGTLDLTKTSGTIEGVLNADVTAPVPYTMGGFYQSGTAQTQLHLTGPVKYVVGYTLTKVNLPGARPPAGSTQALAMIEQARARELAKVPVAPAYTSWVAESEARQVRACLR